MSFDFDKAVLPPIFKRCGKDCYLDGIRQKLIYITPEEEVRQKVISYLIQVLEVPKEMIAVEKHFSHYDLESSKRADIIIHRFDENRILRPFAVIECKAPGVYLDNKAVDQIMDYCNLIGCEYGLVVNGLDFLCYKYVEEENNYFRIESLPKYYEMLKGIHTKWDIGELPPRIPFDKIEDFLKESFESSDSDENLDISSQTEMKKAIPSFNLFEGLLDTRRIMPAGQYKLFRLIEDYGVRMLSYGNAAGGRFFGPYRSFLIEYNGSTEFVSISVTTYWKSSTPNNVKTCLVVAIDTEKSAHHSLQLVIDDNLSVTGVKCDFFHHGRITIGNKGSGKIEELRSFVLNRYPQIISDRKFYLGTLVNDRLWGLDDPEVIMLMENLITYALIRDEFREYVRAKIK